MSTFCRSDQPLQRYEPPKFWRENKGDFKVRMAIRFLLITLELDVLETRFKKRRNQNSDALLLGPVTSPSVISCQSSSFYLIRAHYPKLADLRLRYLQNPGTIMTIWLLICFSAPRSTHANGCCRVSSHRKDHQLKIHYMYMTSDCIVTLQAISIIRQKHQTTQLYKSSTSLSMFRQEKS